MKLVDVILLFGQSNMTGIAKCDLLEKRFPKDFKTVCNGFDQFLIRYYSDGKMNQGFESVKLGQGADKTYFGPEIGIAKFLSTQKLNRKVYIIKFSHGGSSIFAHWNPPSNQIKYVGCYYEKSKEFTLDALKEIQKLGYNPVIRAICWMQGEEDSLYNEAISAYERNLQFLISDFRNDYSLFSNKRPIFFIDAGISKAWEHQKEINLAKKNVFRLSKYNRLLSTINLKLKYNEEPTIDNPDIAHFDSLSELKLGIEFGKEIYKILKK